MSVGRSETSAALVVSAFPATGKSYLAERNSELVDSDSSLYSWEWRGPETRVRHSAWPGNYLEHIRANLADDRSVLCSTHEEVRGVLVKAGLSFVLVYPRADLRTEYIDRMRERGSPGGLIQVVADRWFSWMADLRKQDGCAHVVLGPGEYLRWPL